MTDIIDINNINRITKRLKNFINTYSYFSWFLHQNTHSLKHNDYLNIISKMLGKTSYHQLLISKDNKQISYDVFFEKLTLFLTKFPDGDNLEIEQIIKTFKIYFLHNDDEVKNLVKNLKSKITRLINKKIKNNTDINKNSIYDIQYFYKKLLKSDFSMMLFNYTEIPTIFRHYPEFKESLIQFYDIRNTLLIKNYIKDEEFKSDLGQHMYLFKPFMEKKFKKTAYSLENLWFYNEMFKISHCGLESINYKKVDSEFRKHVNAKVNGEYSLYKCDFLIFNHDNEKIKKSPYEAYNAKGEYVYLDIALSNNTLFSFAIFNNGDIFVHKSIEPNKQQLISYNRNDFLISTSTLFKTETTQVEHSHFFYPKKTSDEFIITLEFKESSKQIILNKDCLTIKNELSITFKEIVDNLL